MYHYSIIEKSETNALPNPSVYAFLIGYTFRPHQKRRFPKTAMQCFDLQEKALEPKRSAAHRILRDLQNRPRYCDTKMLI